MGFGDFLKGPANVGSGILDAGLNFLGTKHLQNDAQSFQKFMASNKYQMAVNDLIAAGLNPILAVKGMSGGSGAAGGMGSFRSNVAQSVANAVQAKKVTKELDLIDAQTGATHNQADLHNANIDNVNSIGRQNKAIANAIDAETIVRQNRASIIQQFQETPLGREAEILNNYGVAGGLATTASALGLKSLAAGLKGISKTLPKGTQFPYKLKGRDALKLDNYLRQGL